MCFVTLRNINIDTDQIGQDSRGPQVATRSGLLPFSPLLQMNNDIAKAKADIAAAEKRQQELQQLVAQAKQGKEDSVRHKHELQGGTGVRVGCRC